MTLQPDRALTCELCWIGCNPSLLGGAAMAIAGFDHFRLHDLLTQLGITAVIGFVLSWFFCPPRREAAWDGIAGSV